SSSFLSRAYYWLELFELSLSLAQAHFKLAREPLSQFNRGSARLRLKNSSQLVSRLGSCGALC
ncbi:9874_t:CDS:1, partial [Rhizophagus irregularis]